MSATLEFITGAAGSGKTTELFARVKAAREAVRECFIIVPEQATFETEKSLAGYLAGGFLGCTVLAWKELARKMLDVLGERRAFLSGEGRIMLVRRSADEVRKDLTVFKKASEKPGFPVECDTLIAKFKRCAMTSSDVKRAAETLSEGEPLRDKLSDIALIMGELELRCASRWLDAEDMVRLLAERMAETPINGAAVFIDGGDTMHEYAYPVFAALLDNAASAAMTITDGEGALFSEEERVLEKLSSMARDRGIRPVFTRLNGRKRPGTEALFHLENELPKRYPREFPAEAEGLSIRVCQSRPEEVIEAAELLRSAAGSMRYSDMAVIVSDPAGYAPYIKRVFTEYGIPYFSDSARSLITYPAARLVLAGLSACESGFGAASVVEAVKTGCFALSADEAEVFENYLLMTGFTGKRLLEPFGDEAIEELRKRVMEPLVRFKEELKAQSAASRARAIHGFLDDLGVYERQRELCDSLRERGMLLEEEENAQVMKKLCEALDQIYVIMGDEPVGMKRFISVVKEGLRSFSVSAIPATVDQVLVGSPDRTRAREVRLLAVLGMNEGLFPMERKDDGVIGDADLEMLKTKGFELWKSTERLTASDEFAVYRSFLKATERIAFSYPAAITGAGSMEPDAKPCRIIKRLRAMFPLITEYGTDSEPTERSGEASMFGELAVRLRRMIDTGIPDAGLTALVAHFKGNPDYEGVLGSMLRNAYGTGGEESIGKELSRKLYGRTMYGSASRLESFGNCPFMHFMQYGIKASERPERKEKNSNLGSFYHEVLQKYVSFVMENGLDWKEIDDEKTAEILRDVVPPIMKEKSFLVLDTARQRARLAGILDSARFTCCAVTRQIARGSFRPTGTEVSFGYSESRFPPLEIRSGDAVFWLAGVIDRIDETPDGMKRVIDYKSGGKDFDFAALMEGIQLQLPLYSAASGAAESVGMYYMPITDIDPTGDETGAAEKRMTEELLKEFRLSGITLRDAAVLNATEEFDGSSTVVRVKYDKNGVPEGTGLVTAEELGFAMDFARQKAAEQFGRILSGEVTARPTKLPHARKAACRYCPYSPVCMFDARLDKLGTKELRAVGAEEFFGAGSQ